VVVRAVTRAPLQCVRAGDKGDICPLARNVNPSLCGVERSLCVEIVMAHELTLHHRRLTAFHKEIHHVRTLWRM